MRVLVVNAGSSSLKLRVLGDDDSTEADLHIDAWDGRSDPASFAKLIKDVPEPDAVGHRVVQGGRRFTQATLVTGEVTESLHALADLAPLHQQRALAGVAAAQQALPAVPHVACFDTGFHATLPDAARTYALPAAWRCQWDLDRYGFHGLSHAWAARRAVELTGHDSDRSRILSCHLGAGASLCAVRDGCSVDTTMGFTPLEGLVMATRSGAVDPGLVLWLVTHGGLAPEEVADGLERHAGLAGLSGTSGDMRDVVAARGAGEGDAVLAFDVYIHRLRSDIAAMAASLGGIDVLAFTGGVGEHSAMVRANTIDGLAFLGLAIDPALNAPATADADLTAPGASARTVVVTSREDLEIARQVRRLLR